MIFAQHGPAWKPKIDRLYLKSLIDGVIWDPREENVERIKEIRLQNSDYRSGLNMLDLKVYYKQFPSSNLKRLEELSYVPNELIDRVYLRNTDNLDTLVQKSIDFQIEFGVEIFVSPSLYLYSFNDRIVDKLFDIWDIFQERARQETKIRKKYVAIIFSESALENKSYISEFLNDFSDISNKFDGIYLVIDRENNTKHRHDFIPSRLKGMLQLIYDLKNLGLEVMIGYVGIESLLYFAVGADAIGTGWFYSLRNFNKEQKGLEPVDTMGRQKKRYTSISMMYELAIEDEIFSIPDQYKAELYDKILMGCELDEKVIGGNIDNINFNEIYQQYFEALGSTMKYIKSQQTIEEKLQIIHKYLNSAEDNIKRYNEIGTLQKINSKHIQSYKIALKDFQEDNFIFV